MDQLSIMNSPIDIDILKDKLVTLENDKIELENELDYYQQQLGLAENLIEEIRNLVSKDFKTVDQLQKAIVNSIILSMLKYKGDI